MSFRPKNRDPPRGNPCRPICRENTVPVSYSPSSLRPGLDTSVLSTDVGPLAQTRGIPTDQEDFGTNSWLFSQRHHEAWRKVDEVSKENSSDIATLQKDLDMLEQAVLNDGRHEDSRKGIMKLREEMSSERLYIIELREEISDLEESTRKEIRDLKQTVHNMGKSVKTWSNFMKRDIKEKEETRLALEKSAS
jgi:hypothetical protein